MELRYYRNIEGKEVDFAITEDGKPIQFIECKWADADISKTLKYLKTRFPETPAWQIHATGKKDYKTSEGVRVSPAVTLLKNLV